MSIFFLLQKFLLYKEISQIENGSKSQKVPHGTSKKSVAIIENGTPNNYTNEDDYTQFNNIGIVVSNVTAKWTDDQIGNSLENINLTVKPDQLVAVIGHVGAGKVFNNTYKYNYINIH